jgi:hypothetical protein
VESRRAQAGVDCEQDPEYASLTGRAHLDITSAIAHRSRAEAVAALAQLPGPGVAARDDKKDIQLLNQR